MFLMSCTNIPLVTDLLGWLFLGCYKLVFSQYLWAIVVFTIATRLLTLPLGIKQQKGSVTMARLKPKIDALNKKFGKDKEKLNEATMALYKEEKYNPAAGCLPMVVQMVILFGLIGVIYNPLQYAARIDSEQITNLSQATAILSSPVVVKVGSNNINQLGAVNEVSQLDINALESRVKKLNDGTETITYVNKVEKNEKDKEDRNLYINGELVPSDKLAETLKDFTDEQRNLLRMDSFIKEDVKKNEDGSEYKTYTLWVDPATLKDIQEFSEDLRPFGGRINFGDKPKLPFSDGGSWGNILWLIPILSGLTAFLSSFITQKINPQQAQPAGSETNPMAGSMKTMMYIMPLMSVWFSFSVPAGLGFYWTCSNVISVGQSLLLNKLYNPKKILAEIEAQEAAKPSKNKQKQEQKEKRAAAIETTGKDLSDFDE